MKNKRTLAAICAVLLLLTGCGGGASTSAAPETTAALAMGSDKMEMAEAEESPEIAFSNAMQSSSAQSDGTVYQRADAKLIRRCSIELQTTEFDVAIDALYDLVEAQSGYFENSSVYGGGYYNANARRTGEYVVRVPAENYSAFRSSVGNLGYVSYSNESTEDIGEQYYDTEARLKTLRTKQERLLMLLEKAETMEDIIELESALGDVEYEIERNSSTLNRYDGLVNYATFNINISEVARVEEQTGQADTLGERMSAGFRSGFEDLKDDAEDFMVWISYHFVGILGFAVVIGVIVAVVRRKKQRFFRFQKKNNGSKNETES